MLKLWLREPMDDSTYVYSAKLIFDDEYEPEWLTEDLIKQMILSVDKSEVISGEVISSPVLGIIPPTRLSGGVKTLIMASHDPSRMYNLTSCGDNCAEWALRLAKDKDIVMRLGHFMDFSEVDSLEIEILNDHTVVHSYMELLDELFKWDV